METVATNRRFFNRVGDRWLVDEIVESWTLAGGEATPTP